MLLNITNLPSECIIRELEYDVSQSFMSIFFMPKYIKDTNIYFSIQKELEEDEVLITRFTRGTDEHVFKVHIKSLEELGFKFILSSLANSNI